MQVSIFEIIACIAEACCVTAPFLSVFSSGPAISTTERCSLCESHPFILTLASLHNFMFVLQLSAVMNSTTLGKLSALILVSSEVFSNTSFRAKQIISNQSAAVNPNFLWELSSSSTKGVSSSTLSDWWIVTLNEGMIEWLSDWVIEWLMNCYIEWRNDWLIEWLNDWMIEWWNVLLITFRWIYVRYKL